MEKYITHIKDLVIQTLTNGFKIKTKAESGDALSCFQMGMIHLLGINTLIDFNKAKLFFSNPSLVNNIEAKRLLGFIAEVEGDFKSAFYNYSLANQSKNSFIKKVYEERINLRNYFKEIGLSDIELNGYITNLVDEYLLGKKPIIETKITLASLTEDEQLYTEAVKAMVDAGDYLSAKAWTCKIDQERESALCASIEKGLHDLTNGLSNFSLKDVIEIEEGSILKETSLGGSFNDTNNAKSLIKNEWEVKARKGIERINKQIAEENAARKRKLEEEETARKQKLEEEEAARKQKLEEEEVARKQKLEEEEAARKRKEAALKRAKARERKKLKEEEERKMAQKSEKELKLAITILGLVLVLSFLISYYLLSSVLASIGISILSIIITIVFIIIYLVKSGKKNNSR